MELESKHGEDHHQARLQTYFSRILSWTTLNAPLLLIKPMDQKATQLVSYDDLDSI
jgi:hypothetical protein